MTQDELSAQPLRVGVVGLGWAGRSHMQAFAAHPDSQLVAIAGQEPDLLKSNGARFGVEGLYESWESLTEHPGLDAISVAVPNFLHAPISTAALNAGLHVLCEKPLARTLDEAAPVVEFARAQGRVLDVAFNKRGRPVATALKKLVDAGSLGKIYYSKAYWLRRNGIPPEGSWFTSREAAGGGALLDIGVHALDLALYVLGEPEALSVTAATFGELGPHGRGRRPVTQEPARKQLIGAAFDVEDFTSALIRLEGDAALHLEASWAGHQQPGDRFGLEVFGTEAGARLSIQGGDPRADSLSAFGDVGGIPAETNVPCPPVWEPESGSHTAVVSSFIDRIRQGKPHSEEYEGQLLRRSSIVDACYASATSGDQIRLKAVTAASS